MKGVVLRNIFRRGSETSTSEESVDITVGPEDFGAHSLEIYEVMAEVEVKISDDDKMRVSMKGPKDLVENIKTAKRGDTLVVTDENKGGNYVFSGNIVSSGSIVIENSVIVSGGPGKTYNSMPRVEISVPKGTPVDITNRIGKITIGDTKGSLAVNARGVGKVNAGAVREARLKVSGVGSVDVDEVVGDLDIDLSGTGSINVRRGAVGRLTVEASGVGSVYFGGKATDAKFSSSGIGSIKAAYVENTPLMKSSGLGKVDVGNW